MHVHSLAEYLEALSTAETQAQKADIATQIAKLLNDEGDYPQAQRYAEDALSVALPTQAGEAHYQRARALFMQDELEATKAEVGKAIASFEQNAQPQEVGKCYNMLGALYTNVHNFAPALENFEQAIEHNETSQNYDQLGRVFAHLAIFVRMAMPAKNIPVFYQNLLADASPARKGYVHQNLGVFYRQEHQDDKALPAFETAFALLKDQPLTFGRSELAYQLASLYDLKGETDKAYHLYLEALALSLEEEKPERVELILYYFSHALEEVQDAEMLARAQSLIAKAEEMGYKMLPTEGRSQDIEANLPTDDEVEIPTDVNFTDKLAEVARLEKDLSAEELGKQYTEAQDTEIGLIWLKKLLNQYNNAWFGRKAKLKNYEDAKAQVLQDIATKLANPEIDATQKEILERVKKELA
jgi:tetratricopeptide (TPR) repeat protein